MNTIQGKWIKQDKKKKQSWRVGGGHPGIALAPKPHSFLLIYISSKSCFGGTEDENPSVETESVAIIPKEQKFRYVYQSFK